MSVKNRVFATAIAAALLAGTASFAASEPRQGRSTTLDAGQGFFAQVFDRVRELLAGRRSAEVRTRPSKPGSVQKDGCIADPNGRPANCG